MATCIYCKRAFEPPKPTTTMCAGCWFGGRHFEAQRPEFIAALRALPGVTRAEFEHTGGGCWGLGVRVADGRYLFAVAAFKEADGEWYGDPSLPDPGQPWGVGTYADDEAGFWGADEALDYVVPVTDEQLIDRVRAAASGGSR